MSLARSAIVAVSEVPGEFEGSSPPPSSMCLERKQPTSREVVATKETEPPEKGTP